MPSKILLVAIALSSGMPLSAATTGVTQVTCKNGATPSGDCLAAGQVQTTIQVAVQIETAARFMDQEYKWVLARKLGVHASTVVIAKKEFVVSVVYTFSSIVTEAQAKKALAAAWGVSESKVTVKIVLGSGRLYQSIVTATTITGELTTDHPSEADAAKTKSADVSAVQAEIQKSLPRVTAVVETEAAVTVKVQTTVIASKTLAQPSATEIASVGMSAGGRGASISSFGSVGSATSTTQAPNPGMEVNTSGPKSGAPAFIFAMAILFPFCSMQ